MASKIWKKLLFIILVVACLFDITIKLVQRNSFKSELQSSAQYVQDMIQNSTENIESTESLEGTENLSNSQNSENAEGQSTSENIETQSTSENSTENMTTNTINLINITGNTNS